jgi:hypothetical protein
VKTQIIRLEPHDDAISVKDKMEWRQTPRILLVWPSRGAILNRRLDLVFLKRHAASLGAQLALVTHDYDVKYYADQLEIQVYPTIRQAEQTHWRQPRHRRKKRRSNLPDVIPSPAQKEMEREKPNLEELRQSAHPTSTPWLANPITRVISFTFGVLGVLAIAALLIPRAEIRLTPKTQTERIAFLVTAHPKNESVDLSGAVPAQSIPVIVEGRSSIPSTGRISTPLATATGEITFSNLTDQIIQVPAGTVVSTAGESPIRFITLDNVDVPPEETIEHIAVQAVFPGTQGNILHKKVAAIEGPLGLILTVTNPRRFSGGSDRWLPAPSNEDYEDVKDQLLVDLYESALTELNFTLAADDRLLFSDPSDFRVIEESYSPGTPEPADQLELTLRVEFHALVASGEDLKTLANAILDAHLPEGFIPLPSTIKIESQGDPIHQENGGFQWMVSAHWQVKAKIDEIQAIRLAQWQLPQMATDALTGYLPIQDSSIKLSPEWWPRLPVLPFRIVIFLDQ